MSKRKSVALSESQILGILGGESSDEDSTSKYDDPDYCQSTTDYETSDEKETTTTSSPGPIAHRSSPEIIPMDVTEAASVGPPVNAGNDFITFVDIPETTNLPSKMGRAQSIVWEYFETKRDANGKIISNICKLCRKGGISAKADRMRKHYENCSKKCSKKTPPAVPVSLSCVPESAPAINESFTASVPPSKQLKQSSLSKFVKILKPKEQDEITLQIGRFIFASNSSFNSVENPEFVKLLSTLNPSYKLPSHETFGATVLEKIYDEIMHEKIEMLTGKKAVLLQDGWSTTQNDPVIAHCLTTPDATHFLCAENVGDETKSGQFCFDLFQKAVKLAEDKLKVKVLGGVTDNCSSMLSLQNLIKQHLPDMEAYGCNAHLLNLVGQRFTPGEVQEKVSLVQKYIRNHHKTSAMLKALDGRRPVIPGSTRWNSQVDSFKNFCKNHSMYLEIVRNLNSEPTNKNASEKKKLEEVLEILKDATFYDKVQAAVETLQPIAVALDKVQGNSSNLADAAHCWITLLEKLPDQITQDPYFQKQRALGMTALASCGYMLDPRYKGRNLPEESKELGLKWMESKKPFFVVYTLEVNNPDSSYFFKSALNSEVANSMDPRNWWKTACKSGVNSDFLELVDTILTFPASTGGIERSLSTLGAIMTKQRNRLSVEKGAKLCSIVNHYKIKYSKM